MQAAPVGEEPEQFTFYLHNDLSFSSVSGPFSPDYFTHCSFCRFRSNRLLGPSWKVNGSQPTKTEQGSVL